MLTIILRVQGTTALICRADFSPELLCVKENFLITVVVRTGRKDLIFPAPLMSFQLSF